MQILINYATGTFKKAQRLNTWTGKHIAGFEKVIEYDDTVFDHVFRDKNAQILKYKNGLFLWKPYCILKTLEKAEENDIVFYCDSGAFFCKRIKKYLDKEVNDIWISNIPFIEKQFSKKKAFELMGCDSDYYRESNQVQGGFVGVRKNSETIAFVREWLRYCENEEILSPDDNAETNDPFYIAHREDQTVLSLLSKKRGIIPYPDPTQYGKVPEEYARNSNYIFKVPAAQKKRNMFLILHRTGEIDIRIVIKQLAVAIIPRKISLLLLKKMRRRGR